MTLGLRLHSLRTIRSAQVLLSLDFARCGAYALDDRVVRSVFDEVRREDELSIPSGP